MPEDNAFIEEPQGEDTARVRPRPRSIRIKLSDEGTINWDQLSDAQVETLKAAITTDPAALEAFAASLQGPEGAVQLIQPKHVEQLLDTFAFIQRLALPPIFKSWAKKNGQGELELDAEIVDQVLRFSDEEKKKIGPPAALALESFLPERIKQWIAQTGPGAEALLLLFQMEAEKVKRVVVLSVAKQQAMKARVPNKPNGGAAAGMGQPEPIAPAGTQEAPPE